MMDYLIDIDGTSLRTSIETHEAIAGGLLFRDGDNCVVGFHDLHWFEAGELQEVIGTDIMEVKP
jgi:iron(III) transport system ATP-binding protein